VRTTIRIDDDLYREVKERAARGGCTVAAVLEDAVCRGLNLSEKGPRVAIECDHRVAEGCGPESTSAPTRR
jgi:hypothetical protein